jgi:hypothetical protein
MTSKDDEMAERLDTMRNDADVCRQQQQAQGTTMHEFAQSEANQDLGRYGAAMGKPTVTGSTPIVRYPQASAPWQGPDPVGDEPSLGYSIDQLEPSAVPPVEDGAPAGATASAENIPPSQDQSGDAGAPLPRDQDNG